MPTGELGKIYKDGEDIMKQGEKGNCMYVIQEGQVEIIREKDAKEMRLAIAGEGDFIGEMAIFESETRSATVRALGDVRLITVDKENFIRRVNQDPSIAFRLVKTLIQRIREMNREMDKFMVDQTHSETIRFKDIPKK
jgi:CRP/FNR family transcriptional regulator